MVYSHPDPQCPLPFLGGCNWALGLERDFWDWEVGAKGAWVGKAEKPEEEQKRRKGLGDGGWAQEHLGQCEGAGGVGGSSPHPR